MSVPRPILRCPVCGGDIVDISVEEYEDGASLRIVITGKCSRCGAPFKRERLIRKDKHNPWRADVRSLARA
jgi:uncharacterized protein with PIN domain